MLHNQVLSEHVVEVHSRNEPASPETYFGPDHAWDSGERERMGNQSAGYNRTVGGRNRLPLKGAGAV